MKGYVATILVTGLFLTSLAANVSPVYSGDRTPPAAQPLVREGDFAVRLSQGLMGGGSTDESEAENRLASIGIAPRNGWIADYPVTPAILGGLKESVRAAADSGALAKGGDEALRALADAENEFGLYVYTGPDANSSYGGQAKSAGSYSDSAAAEGNDDENGPPVVSYYSPPDYYASQYDWVPYPFWWSDVWFPGFFVLADFDIIVHRHHRFHHFRDGDHFVRVTNHVVNNTTGRIARVDPATGNLNANVRGSANMNSARTPAGTAQTSAGKIPDRSVAKSSTVDRQIATSQPGVQSRDMDRGNFQTMSPNVSPHSERSLPVARGSGGVPSRSFSSGTGHGQSGFSVGHSGGGRMR